MKIKLKILKSLYIPDHCLQRQYADAEEFMKDYKLDKKHTFYYWFDNKIYAFD